MIELNEKNFFARATKYSFSHNYDNIILYGIQIVLMILFSPFILLHLLYDTVFFTQKIEEYTTLSEKVWNVTLFIAAFILLGFVVPDYIGITDINSFFIERVMYAALGFVFTIVVLIIVVVVGVISYNIIIWFMKLMFKKTYDKIIELTKINWKKSSK